MFAGKYKKILVIGLAVVGVILAYGMLTMPDKQAPVERISDAGAVVQDRISR